MPLEDKMECKGKHQKYLDMGIPIPRVLPIPKVSIQLGSFAGLVGGTIPDMLFCDLFALSLLSTFSCVTRCSSV